MQDLIAQAEPATQPALLADWRDLAKGRRDHLLWHPPLHFDNNVVVATHARLSSVRGADGRVEQVAALIEVEEGRPMGRPVARRCRPPHRMTRRACQ